ncbi:MAG: hypothetical protein ACYC75_00750 [Minisyncoccota bacterium]
MNTKSFTGVFAILLIFSFVAPVAFLAAPQRASAAGASCVGGLLGGVGGAVYSYLNPAVPNNSAIENITTAQTAGATLGTCINDLVLMPLARNLIKQAIQNMTASVITFINGGSTNGTGQPSYVPNLATHMQLVGDSTALPFIAQTATGFNSPFGSAIALSLQTNYNQQTSVGGFFGANQCTLNDPSVSPNINSFVAGNWSQGGTGAWFALTGPTPNNPYVLQQAAQSQQWSLVNQAQTNQRQDLLQSGGFLSWCGGANSSITTLNGAINLKEPCVNFDGSQANAQTPGSIIAGYAQKAVVGSGFDQEYAQLISANDIDSALSAIANALIGQVLGSTGLFGSSQPSIASGSSLTTQLRTYSPSGTSAAAPQTAAASMAQATLNNVTNYTNAWQTVISAAKTASTNATSLATFCTTAANTANTATSSSPQLKTFVTTATAEAAAAQTSISTEISPVITQAQTAISSVANTQAFALKVQAEATSPTAGSGGALAADTQALATMPPSATDLATAQQNAQTFGGATANPGGSLTVSGGSLIDQMNLINTNATALRSVCIPPPMLQ